MARLGDCELLEHLREGRLVAGPKHRREERQVVVARIGRRGRVLHKPDAVEPAGDGVHRPITKQRELRQSSVLRCS